MQKLRINNKTIVKLPPFKVKKVVATLSEVIDWGLTQLNVPETWLTTQGENVTVMIIDTGWSDHEDLKEAYNNNLSKSFVTYEKNKLDGNGHSTHCQGVIGARVNNVGIVGVAPKCNLIAIKALDSRGIGDTKWINNALKYAIEVKPDVVSMSLGSSQYDKTQHELIKELYKMNIPVICAAGNEGGANAKKNTVNYPAKLPETISVAAFDRNGNIANFSSWGEEVDVAAPGVDIYSTWLNQEYAMLNGTSMATPFIAGLVALLIAKHNKQEKETGKNDCKTVEDIRTHLTKYAHDKGEKGKDNSWGYGAIDPKDSIEEPEINTTPDVVPEIPEPPKEDNLSIWQKFWNLICFWC